MDQPRRKKSYPLNIFSRWDGSQTAFDVKAKDILDSISDDLMNSRDINRALRRLMQRGFESGSGDWVKGLKEMREKLRKRREEILNDHDLGGIYDEINEALEKILDMEHQTLEAMQKAEAGNREKLNQRSQKLENLPKDLPSKIQELSEYDFLSEQASAEFEELMKNLRNQLMDAYMNRITKSMEQLDTNRMKDMLNALNKMLEAQQAGEDPGFEDFMQKFGDMFGDNPPQSLDELLQAMAQSMAAMNAMWNSMTPEQRSQLQDLAGQLLEDMDLEWQLSRLSHNLENVFGNLNLDPGYDFQGDQPVSMSSAPDIFSELTDIEGMQQQLDDVSKPADLGEIDEELARQLLGEDDAKSLKELAEIAKKLEEAGFVTPTDEGMTLSPKAIRHIGNKVLGDIMQRLEMDMSGDHNRDNAGFGHELEFETKPYEWGDTFNLNIQQTVRNAITRKGSGVPVKIQPEDFEVERTQQKVSSATVLMLDLSLSMEMRNNFVSAKKVAIALHSLIGTKYPRDYLGIVGFSWAAKEIGARELVDVGVDWLDHGTNMEHGLKVARSMLKSHTKGHTGTRQIIMITDGEPTAHLDKNGVPQFYYPPVPETIDKTLAEVMRATKDEIIINIFMLDAYPGLKRFIEHITRLNGGRAFFTTPETLGDYVISDFVGKRRN